MLLDALKRVHLLARAEAIEAYDLLHQQLSTLRNNFESFETWGVHPIDWSVVHQIRNMLTTLRHKCTVGQKDGPKEDMDNQALLRKMGIHDVVLRGLEMQVQCTTHCTHPR
jgi:hypothetical protein